MTDISTYNIKNDRHGTVAVAVIFGFIGIVIACGYVLLINMLDNTVKTEADIEKYQISCGKEEGTAYGKVTVSKRLSDNGYDAALHVQLEDYTGGELQLSNSGFSWYGSDGSCLGNGESITVTQNGTYRVAVGLQNQDITGGQASITVSDIREYVPPTPAPTSEPVQEPIQEPIPETEPDPTPEPVTESKEMVEVPEPEKKEGLPAIAPTEVPVVIEEETIVLEKEAVTQKAAVREMIQPTPAKTPTPTIKPFIKKETETVKAEEKLSTYEVLPEIRSVQEEKPSLLASPVVKVITVTVGTFTIFTGLFLLYYLLRRSVAVYNDDGSGRMKYIGRCLIQENDKGYLLTITEKMIQNAMTNRYMIKPGIFGWGKQNEELVVEKQSKLIPVLIEKEMIVVI